MANTRKHLMVAGDPVGATFGAYEALSVSTSAVGFTAATVADYEHATITCEKAAVRFRLDTTNPTTTVGHELFPGDALKLNSNAQILNARFISRDGATATLSTSFGS